MDVRPRLGDWIGVHPLLVVAQLGYLAIYLTLCAEQLLTAALVAIVLRNVVMFAAFYGGLYALFCRLPAHRRVDVRPPLIVRAELRRSVVSWLVAASYEALIALAVASGHVRLQASTSVLTAVALLLWADFHFFATHRLLHWPPLYRRVHYVHHLSTRTNPWSTFSFHPLEAVVYFSAMLIVLVVPVSLVHVALLKIAVDYTGAYGHSGIASVFGGARFHQHHHQVHKKNYGASIVWDRLFGSLDLG